ncbi:MAG: NAD-binding protein, partial [Geminicoccaceae bacterium]
DFALLFDNIASILALTLGLIVLKVGILLLLARLFRLRGADRWLFGLSLAQAGEFGFVLLSFTVANQAIPESVADQLLLIVALSMLLTPALFILYERVIEPRFAQSQEREADEIDEPGDIIIAGHGRFGGIVNRMLRAAGYTPTVLDYSAAHLDALRPFGFKVFYGDATRPDLLHAAGIEKARLLIVAIDGKEPITELVRYVQMTYPNVRIVARAVDRQHVYDLYAAGCREIVRETFDSSVRAARSAYEVLGMHPFDAEQLARKFTEDDRFILSEMAEVHDPDTLPHLNEAYVERSRSLMEEHEAKIFAKGRAFATRTDRGWSPPKVEDVEAATAAAEQAG